MSTLNIGNKTCEFKWYVIDATDKVLGRLASVVATYLIGKNRETYSTNIDLGDFVVVLNIEKIRTSGVKYYDKVYNKHSGYPGGLKSVKYRKLHIEFPDKIFITSVKGMLPKNRLMQMRLSKLKVYIGGRHPHSANKLTILEV
jgi:large subunit ribosomal protein L13